MHGGASTPGRASERRGEGLHGSLRLPPIGCQGRAQEGLGRAGGDPCCQDPTRPVGTSHGTWGSCDSPTRHDIKAFEKYWFLRTDWSTTGSFTSFESLRTYKWNLVHPCSSSWWVKETQGSKSKIFKIRGEWFYLVLGILTFNIGFMTACLPCPVSKRVAVYRAPGPHWPGSALPRCWEPQGLRGHVGAGGHQLPAPLMRRQPARP